MNKPSDFSGCLLPRIKLPQQNQMKMYYYLFFLWIIFTNKISASFTNAICQIYKYIFFFRYWKFCQFYINLFCPKIKIKTVYLRTTVFFVDSLHSIQSSAASDSCICFIRYECESGSLEHFTSSSFFLFVSSLASLVFSSSSFYFSHANWSRMHSSVHTAFENMSLTVLFFKY